MAQIDTHVLPLMPLTTGVVLPGMVVTLTVESDEARAAVDAVSADDERLLLLVPRLDGRYARVGTIAKIEDVGALRGGTEALVIRGLQRATIGAGVPGTGEAVWVQVEPVEESEPTDRAKQLAREYRAVVENIVESRGVPQVAEFLRGISDPGQIADTSGYSPDLSFEQKIEVLETARRRGAPGQGARVGEGHAGRPRPQGQDPHRRQRRHGEAPARVPAARADERHPQGAGRGRRGERRRGVPREDRGRRHARRRPRRGRARAGPSGAHVRAVARVRLDPHLPRLDDGAPVERPHGGQAGHRGGARRARRRPRGAGGREGPHPGVPGRAQAPPGARPGRGDRARFGRHPHAGRARPAWARPRWASPWRGPSAASSCGSRWAGSTTRPRSAATAAPTSARCRAASCGP